MPQRHAEIASWFRRQCAAWRRGPEIVAAWTARVETTWRRPRPWLRRRRQRPRPRRGGCAGRRRPAGNWAARSMPRCSTRPPMTCWPTARSRRCSTATWTLRWRSALALRMLGGVHALVLTGQAPELAPFYPSAGGTADPGPAAPGRGPRCGRCWPGSATRSGPGWTGRRRPTRWAGPRRCSAACAISAPRPGLPVRLVEIGASAGLNLRADRFHVAGDAGEYGDPSSPVSLTGAWLGTPPPEGPVEVAARTGGDRSTDRPDHGLGPARARRLRLARSA